MVKKIPMRQCIGCGEMKPKRELIRVVRPKEGEISLDLTGKMPGRGAYLCRNAECLRMAQKSRRLERSFSCKVEPEVYEVMLHALSEADGNS
ncbi:MAG: YlxR family protein [Oscillospiraceae bacterium]|nr:YlxR family protein [Oscillospiraceae bacterium]